MPDEPYTERFIRNLWSFCEEVKPKPRCQSVSATKPVEKEKKNTERKIIKDRIRS